ncbi:nucleolar zinc-finger protein [Scheffersomyces stipitis CBS 6054]|uniref:Nucleolar zinc-finger protein n=1 Tax=Scheffersomyces stipitis (strain ATCC 58785 / CBS 6054 / NBRC 10063 / NRRL Y-11545) TaxID=322104 RepID=A3GFK2_PICST|nr:nucleolar zinc-finger protein [Scheffersomyces stipitis CBS 6054]EAZ63363.1 nucleolar zinc-finger protein [Scheffersomyces stipitis CBS 6054]
MAADEEQKPQDLFTSVGEQAQEVDDQETNVAGSNEVRQTGAEDAEGHPVQEIESLCMNCHKNGITRMLLTKIPYFREIILMSFECTHCGFKNSEIQPAAQIAEKGSRYVLKLETKEDFNRQVVKSETASVRFSELDIEIPPKRGQLSNIEGLLEEMIEDLESDQPARETMQPEIYQKIKEVITKIRSFINAEPNTLPLTFTIDDPAGNSWIEYLPGEPSHKWAMYEYSRTAEQNVFLGLISADDVARHQQEELANKKNATSKNISSSLNKSSEKDDEHNPRATGFISDETEIENFENEVQTFQATCSSCFQPCSTHMKTVNIPHFKDVILMSTVCDHCGYKSNEVKTGGEIPPRGKKITLKITDPEDLARDILKSETCGLSIPELNLDLTPGTLGGRFTTIEGLLTQVAEELNSRVFSQSSDSMDEATKSRWTSFFARLQDAIDGKIPFTIIVEDPLASSYIQNVYAPDNDPNMTIEEFERSFQQNEDLGLNDMKTD